VPCLQAGAAQRRPWQGGAGAPTIAGRSPGHAGKARDPGLVRQARTFGLGGLVRPPARVLDGLLAHQFVLHCLRSDLLGTLPPRAILFKLLPGKLLGALARQFRLALLRLLRTLPCGKLALGRCLARLLLKRQALRLHRTLLGQGPGAHLLGRALALFLLARLAKLLVAGLLRLLGLLALQLLCALPGDALFLRLLGGDPGCQAGAFPLGLFLPQSRQPPGVLLVQPLSFLARQGGRVFGHAFVGRGFSLRKRRRGRNRRIRTGFDRRFFERHPECSIGIVPLYDHRGRPCPGVALGPPALDRLGCLRRRWRRWRHRQRIDQAEPGTGSVRGRRWRRRQIRRG